MPGDGRYLKPQMTSPLSYGPFISRAQAKDQGIAQFVTGKPCKYAHLTARYTKTGICVGCTEARTIARAKRTHGGAPKSAQLHQPEFERRIRQHFGDRYDLSEAIYTGWDNKVAVTCLKHNHTWQAFPGNIMRGHGCPECDRDRKRVERPLTKAERCKRSRDNNPMWPMINTLRQRVHKAVKAQRSYKGSRTRELIGCSYQELRNHLASQFEPGMSWDNHGEWEIDHIRPVASFDLSDLREQEKCFHFSNLQPLWRAANRKKSDKWKPVAA